jgi:hypothetical protein
VRAQDGKRFVAYGSEPSARQAEHSGKRESGGGSPHLPSASLPAAASPLQDKPSAAESGGVGGDSTILPSASLPAVASRLQDNPSAAASGGVGVAAPSCDSKLLEVGYTAVTIRESACARRLAERRWTAPQTWLSEERGLGDIVQFILPICKESKQAHCEYVLMARAVCFSVPVSGAAHFLRTFRLG